MFYHLLLIHLYRPFLKYTRSTSPLPQHVSPRRLCTQAASAISKQLRMYKRAYGFQRLPNVVVYIAHTACTIHLLNLPEKNAQRDIIHGLRNLEEMGGSWLCARRTLRILDISAHKWQVQLPHEASSIFERTHAKWGSWGSWDQPTSPSTNSDESPPAATPQRAAATQSGLSVSGSHPQVPSQGSASSQVPPGPVTSMAPQYQPGSSTHTPVPEMRTARHSISVQLQKPDSHFLPEPTYLRPVSHVYQPVQAVPLTQHDAWYNANEHQIPTMDAEQASPSTTNASSLNAFDGPTSLVEESQDWWSRNSGALGFGMANWDEGWGIGIPGPAPSHPLQTSGTGHAPPPQPSQPMEFPVAVPHPDMLESEQNQIMYTNMGFPPPNFDP